MRTYLEEELAKAKEKPKLRKVRWLWYCASIKLLPYVLQWYIKQRMYQTGYVPFGLTGCERERERVNKMS